MNMMIAGPRRVGGVLVLATLLAMAQGYAPRGVALGQAPARRVACGPRVRASERGGSAPPRPVLVHRRAAVLPLLGGAFGGALVLGGAEPARALVKGVAPPETLGGAPVPGSEQSRREGGEASSTAPPRPDAPLQKPSDV